VESQGETIGDHKELQQIVLGARISRLGELLLVNFTFKNKLHDT